MTTALAARIAAGLARPVVPEVAAFAARLATEAHAIAVLFYGSNLRTGALDGVLDFYVLVDGSPERGIWPRVSYREWDGAGVPLRAKIATMTLAKFAQAASGALLDTTIWTRFVQPAALVWSRDMAAREATHTALAAAATTAARLAAVLGPPQGSERQFWVALFEATYRAEFRIESASRVHSILDLNREHFDGLLAPALDEATIPFAQSEGLITPTIGPLQRRRVLRWWRRRRRLGKPLNLVRLVKAASTFDGAARYAAWKVERHSGVAVTLTPWRERHPVLAAPGVMLSVWRERRRRAR